MSIEALHVGKQFGVPATRVLTDCNLSIPDGQFVSLIGRSGAGKSTLLYILSSLDNPTEGKVIIGDRDVSTLNSKELHWLRNSQIGFVFQFHYLIAELTVIENVLVPTLKVHQENLRRGRAEQLIDQFGLSEKSNRYPRQLSGGEMQRVALARALIMQPKYLFADEPTGALDSANADTVLRILRDQNLKDATTIIMVTHDADFAKMADRQIRLADGHIVEDLDLRKPQPSP